MKTYIQIGANIGNDDFFEKMKSIDRPSIIHLFEPNKNLVCELNKNYSAKDLYKIYKKEKGL